MTALLEAEDLVKEYRARGTGRGQAVVRAVDGVSFAVRRGETFGVVGESGSGKSTLARCLTRIVGVTSGQLRVDGADVLALRGKRLRTLRRDIGFVFQNPVAALNPRMVVADLVGEPLRTHEGLRGKRLTARVADLLDDVGLARTQLVRYPHQLSGGQCQRVGIARAIATRPRIVVLDEPTSALDLSVQAQILNLLADLRRAHELTYVLISHDLDVVRHLSDRVAVMYLGRFVETGPAARALRAPAHPYTRALLASAPGGGRAALMADAGLLGEIPSGTSVPAGCRFHPRCPRRLELGNPPVCTTDDPTATALTADHFAACHFPLEAAANAPLIADGDAR